MQNQLEYIPNGLQVQFNTLRFTSTAHRLLTTHLSRVIRNTLTLLGLRPYLEGTHFDLYTDHQALRWILSGSDHSGRLARWRLRLLEFDFTVTYKKGAKDTIADAISRLPTYGEAKLAPDTQAQPAIIRVPRHSIRETTAVNPSSVLDSDEDPAVPSTAQEEDPSPVLDEHAEDQVDADDTARLNLQDEAGTPAMATVQPSTVLANPVSTDTEAEQSAMDGAELAANRQNISDISDDPEPSRTFSRMRKTRSLHYAFDKIVDHDLTGPEPVYKIRWTSRPSSEDTYGTSHTML